MASKTNNVEIPPETIFQARCVGKREFTMQDGTVVRKYYISLVTQLENGEIAPFVEAETGEPIPIVFESMPIVIKEAHAPIKHVSKSGIIYH